MNQIWLVSVFASAFRAVVRGALISFIRGVFRWFGGFMMKLLILGILASTLSNLTGIPTFPIQPVISNDELKFIPATVDSRKLESFKSYLSKKF